MRRKINPNLIKLAEQTHNPELKIDETVLERQVEEVEVQAPDLEGYIYVPSIGLYVANERSLNGLNWNQTQTQLRGQKLAMPTPYQFREFLKFLRTSKYREHAEIFSDITEVRIPWKGEWLNARFEKRRGSLYMISENILVQGQYQNIEQKLDDVLMTNKTPGISLDSWLNSDKEHGLPPVNIQAGRVYYWKPVKDCVARFVANSGRAYLSCDWGPEDSDSSLGVRAVREAHSRSGK